MKDLGFRRKRAENNRRVLIENSDKGKTYQIFAIAQKVQIRGLPIVYMDESYVLTSYVSSKIWSDGSTNGLHTPISKGERLIIVQAGGDQGFVPNALICGKLARSPVIIMIL